VLRAVQFYFPVSRPYYGLAGYGRIIPLTRIALEAPMYRLFTNEAHIQKPDIPTEIIPRRAATSKQEREVRAFAKLLAHG
jgi:hypothetical protein